MPAKVSRMFSKNALTGRASDLLAWCGFHESLAVPLLRERAIIGGLVVRRKTTGPFRLEVVELLKPTNCAVRLSMWTKS